MPEIGPDTIGRLRDETNSGGGFVYFLSLAQLPAGDLTLEREGRSAQADSNRRPCNLSIYGMQAGAILGYGFLAQASGELRCAGLPPVAARAQGLAHVVQQCLHAPLLRYRPRALNRTHLFQILPRITSPVGSKDPATNFFSRPPVPAPCGPIPPTPMSPMRSLGRRPSRSRTSPTRSCSLG